MEPGARSPLGRTDGGTPAAGDADFRRLLFARVLARCFEVRAREGTKRRTGRDPYDFQVGPAWSHRPRRRLLELATDLGTAAGFSRRQFDVGRAARSLAETAGRIEGLAATHRELVDERSKDLLLDLLAYRALGPRHVALPVGTEWFWRECARLDRAMRADGEEIDGPGGVPLRRYSLPSVAEGTPIELYGHPVEIVVFYVLEEYAYRRSGAAVAVEPGDVVIDGGGLWGETALLFADATGPAGQVFVYELDQRNLEVARRNLALNDELAARIEVVPRALWDRSGDTLTYEPAGASTTVAEAADGPGEERLPAGTEAIDDLVERASLDRVDFVKLDVEGAELKALRGAEATLRRFRPKLAMSAYHRPEDLDVLPGFIRDLDLGYELFLDHFSPQVEETILFARPR